jgi:DNA-damage-inducible protein J
MKDQIVRARIEGGLKSQALKVLASHGLDLSDAIRLFLRQVVARGGIPFPIRNRPGLRIARAGNLRRMKTVSQVRDRALVAQGSFAAGELFLIRPEDARAAKVVWPACKLSD